MESYPSQVISGLFFYFPATSLIPRSLGKDFFEVLCWSPSVALFYEMVDLL